jgi:hypothetical protein
MGKGDLFSTILSTACFALKGLSLLASAMEILEMSPCF